MKQSLFKLFTIGALTLTGAKAMAFTEAFCTAKSNDKLIATVEVVRDPSTAARSVIVSSKIKELKSQTLPVIERQVLEPGTVLAKVSTYRYIIQDGAPGTVLEVSISGDTKMVFLAVARNAEGYPILNSQEHEFECDLMINNK